MKNYRVCKNENSKYKLQKRVKLLKLFPVWLDYGRNVTKVFPPLHKTTIYNTKKEALLQLEEIKDREVREIKDKKWKCQSLL